MCSLLLWCDDFISFEAAEDDDDREDDADADADTDVADADADTAHGWPSMIAIQRPFAKNAAEAEDNSWDDATTLLRNILRK